MGATLILINGHSGSGKTTLAHWLAAELRVPCLSKDLFKETLYERQPPPDREASRELGRLAYDLLFATGEAVLTSGSSVILEAPLHRAFSHEVIEGIAARQGVEVAQVLLAADPAVLEARYLARQSSVERHAGHDVGFTVEELRAGVAQPIDAPRIDATLEVNTDDFAALDRSSVAFWLRARLATTNSATR